jgi:nucleoside-diphosphate kinase
MSTEKTFAIVKPDAVKAGKAGQILARIEAAGFTIRGMRLQHLSLKEAEGFYAVHAARPFFGELTQFMSSGPCVLLCLEAPDAIKKWRDTMGPTDPAKADPGTLRRDFGTSIGNNATHGSDVRRRLRSNSGISSAEWSFKAGQRAEGKGQKQSKKVETKLEGKNFGD